MPESSRLEKVIQAEILLAYGALPWIRLWRNSAGVGLSMDGERVITFGLEGSADIMGLISGGRAVAIEVKQLRGRKRESQKAFQAMFEGLGGLYVLARSVEDVDAAFAAIGRGR